MWWFQLAIATWTDAHTKTLATAISEGQNGPRVKTKTSSLGCVKRGMGNFWANWRKCNKHIRDKQNNESCTIFHHTSFFVKIRGHLVGRIYPKLTRCDTHSTAAHTGENLACHRSGTMATCKVWNGTVQNRIVTYTVNKHGVNNHPLFEAYNYECIIKSHW